jgi:hypothetical protein
MNARALAAFVVCLLVASPAKADDAPQAALAEKLFRDGRALLADGKVREACESFSESKKLDPTPGTLLNLARCLDDLGRTASAWAIYRELETRATRLGQTTRAEFARQRASELEPRLPTIEIRVPAAHRVDGLTVECDGTVLGSAALSMRVPVDPGRHQIVARAPARQGWTASVDVATSQPSVVEIPLLALASPDREPEPTASATTKPNLLRPLGIGLAVAGGVATVTGLVFGGVAKLENDGARRDACVPQGCTADGLARIHRADDLATVSTVVTISGLSLAAAGIVLWLLAPPRAERVARATALPGKLLVGGTF